MNMKKIMHSILKSSLVAAGVMGVVPLNAWWCEDCKLDHRGQVCPVSGKGPDGHRHEGWEQDVDEDDKNAIVAKAFKAYRQSHCALEDTIMNQLLTESTSMNQLLTGVESIDPGPLDQSRLMSAQMTMTRWHLASQLLTSTQGGVDTGLKFFYPKNTKIRPIGPRHVDPFKFGNGFGGDRKPTDYPQVGVTPDGIPVHQDGIDFRTADNKVVVKVGDQFLYYDDGRMHDGKRGVDVDGTPLQLVGYLATGGPIYRQVLELAKRDPSCHFFTVEGRYVNTIIQLKNGHFAYKSPKMCQEWNRSHAINDARFFDGQNFFDLDGNPRSQPPQRAYISKDGNIR